MPVSASQHRMSSGTYQNKQYDNIKSNTIPVQNIISNHSTIPDEICRFGNNINQAINYYAERHVLSSQQRAPSPSVIVPALLILSQIKLTHSPSYKPSFMPDRDISLLPSDNLIYPDNGFSTLLNPVVNTLYKTGEMISQYDPLKFPVADAVYLPATTSEAIKISDVHFFSEKITEIINKTTSAINSHKEISAIKKTINKLNNIAMKAEEEFPSGPFKNKNIDHLIYLIDNSKNIIDKFEIKYGQENLCETLRLQTTYYIEMANNISDDKSQLEFQKYLEALPSLTFTPDSRGNAYPSIESQIAGNLVSSVFGSENDQYDTIEYGSLRGAYQSLLISLLAEKKIGSINNLPAGWEKGDEAFRLVNLLLRDLELNLNSKGEMYLLPSAEIFYLSYRESLIKDSTLPTSEREFVLNDAAEDKLLFLRERLKKPMEIKYNQQPDSVRFRRFLDLFITIQCITEIMHNGHLPAGRKDSSDHHPEPKIDPHNIRSYQQCKNVGNLKPEYNRNTLELTIRATSGKSRNLKENNTEMEKILSDNKIIEKIKFKPMLSLRRKKNHSTISKELKNIIRPEMYAMNMSRKFISGVDDIGLIYGRNGAYLRVNKHYVKVTHITSLHEINNRYFISENQNKNLYLRFREDEKFHPESFNERLNVDEIIDSMGITSNERYALHMYGLIGHNNIKKFMSEGMPENYAHPELRASMVKIIDDIQSALNKLPPYKENIFKAITTNNETLNSLKKDQLLTSKTFLSCAKHPRKARKFSTSLINPHNSVNNHHLLIQFNTKKSGHSIEWYTEKFLEQEILIESNKYFKITKISLNTFGEKLFILAEIDSSLLSNSEKSLAKNMDF